MSELETGQSIDGDDHGPAIVEAAGQGRLFPSGAIRQRLNRYQHGEGCNCFDCCLEVAISHGCEPVSDPAILRILPELEAVSLLPMGDESA